jgi:hypothetical protein
VLGRQRLGSRHGGVLAEALARGGGAAGWVQAERLASGDSGGGGERNAKE